MGDSSVTKPWVWPVVAALAAILAIPGVFTLSRVFFVRDLTTSFLPHHLWFHEMLLQGRAPFWNPYPGCGYATVSDPAFQTLFPLTLPLRLLPPIVGFNLIVALPFPIAALGMVFFLRRRVSAPSACLGAVVVAASGAMLSTASTPNLAWSTALIPWILLGTDTVAQRPTLRGGAALAAGFATMLLAGEPVTFAATALLAVVYGVFAADGAGWRSSATAAASTLAALVAGGLLGAVQVLPLLDAHARSIRAAGAIVDTWSLHPASLLELVAPFLYGKWVGMPHEITQWLFALNDRREPLLVSLYVGAGAVLLALLGARLARPRRLALFWCLVLGVALVAAFGSHTPIYPAAKRAIPILASFRFPSKHVLFATVALGSLAAYGFEALTRERAPRRSLALPVALAALLAIVAVAGILLALAFPLTGLALGERLARSWSLPDPAAAGGSFVARMGTAAPRLFLLSVVSGLVLLLAGSGRREARFARRAVFVLVIADLVVTNASINPTIDFAALAPFDWVEATKRHPQDRVFVSMSFGNGLHPIDDGAPLPKYPPGEPPTVHQALFDTALCDYWSGWSVRKTLSRDLTGLRPREYLTLLQRFSESDRTARYRFLSWAGTRYYLAAAPPPMPAVELARLPNLGTMALYEGTPTGSRAAVLQAAIVEPDVDAQIGRLFDPGFDPARTVLVDREPGSPAGPRGPSLPSAATVVEESTTSVVLEATAADTAYLVLLDSYDPGWRVEVDGVRSQLLRADGVFRAVRISAGAHRVRFFFRPRSLTLGAIVSALTGLALLSIVRLGRPGGKRLDRETVPERAVEEEARELVSIS